MSQGMVLYTDGGANPNPGPAGWGMHGYLYETEELEKPITGLDQYVTIDGYIPKSIDTKQKSITPVHYVDGYGSISYLTTNNVAELMACLNGFKHAMEYDITALSIYTDSKYLCDGINIYTDTWKKNGWVRRDGSPVAHIGIWKEIVFLQDALEKRGVKISVTWVKAHTDGNTNVDTIIGNVIADKLANVGVFAATRRNYKISIETKTPEGYWKYTVNKHPFIFNRRMYFNTIKEYNVSGEYFLGEHGKEDDMLGKKISSGSYSVIKLKTPDLMLEQLRDYETELADGNETLVMVRMDQLYKESTHKAFNDFGLDSFKKSNQFKLDLFTLDKEPLTRELNPPKIAMRAVDCLNDIATKLVLFKNNSTEVTATDITSIIYTVEEKKQKKKGEETILKLVKLKPEFNVGYAAIDINVNYKIKDTIENTNIILTLGIDIIDRNALKRIESLNPKVTIITWPVSDDIFRYATVIECGDDIGIWCGYYSNTCYIKLNENKE